SARSELAPARWVSFGASVAHVLANLAERLLLELADSLAREVVLVADLLERELVLVVEAETPADDARLDRREVTEKATDLFTPLLGDERLVGRLHVVVLEEVDELPAVLVADGAIEREGRLGPRALYLVELLLWDARFLLELVERRITARARDDRLRG